MKNVVFPKTIKKGSVTVKVYRTPSHGCESFTLSYYQDGVRKRPAFPTWKAARKAAVSVANRLGSIDAYTLTLTGADCAAYRRARQLLDPLGIAIETAAAQVADTRTRLGKIPVSYVIDQFLKREPVELEQKSVRIVVAEFMKAKQLDGLSARYLEALRYCFKKFEAEFKCNIGDVSATAIDDWLRKSGLSPRSRNNLRNSVQTLFGFAKSRRYLPKDHDEIESVPVVKDREGAIEVFTPAELVEILKCAGDELVPFFALGAFAGIRHAEIQRLEWKDIRFEDGIIELHAAKARTASRRTVPMLDNLRLWLLPHRQASGLVCKHCNMSSEIEDLVKRINKTRRAAWAKSNGVGAQKLREADELARERLASAKAKKRRGAVAPGAETAEEEGWDGFAWKHNALRHSFISYRVAAIQNVNQAALEAGNSPQMIFRHYRELVRPADAKAWFGIEPDADGKVTVIPKADEAAVAVARGAAGCRGQARAGGHGSG